MPIKKKCAGMIIYTFSLERERERKRERDHYEVIIISWYSSSIYIHHP